MSSKRRGIRAWWRRSDGSPRLWAVVLTGGLMAAILAPAGVAATGKVLREGVRNGTATKETKIVSRVPATNANTGGYTTRQSNISPTGGGAIYGCRAGAGGSAAKPPQKPCIRANNLSTGLAFEFNSREGETAGTITVGGGGDGKRPFTTNATGVATGLNAERVGSRTPEQIVDAAKTRWLLLNEKGEIVEQSGGFKVVEAYSSDQNVYVDAGAKLEGTGLTATIAATQIDAGSSSANPGFGGLVTVARCQFAGIDCAPAGAKNDHSFVVSARKADGSAAAGTDADPRKRVYVTIAP